MDLKQRKLTKTEWDGIEIPVNKDELDILRLIINGFSNIHLKVNKTDSIFTHLKIEYNNQIEEFLYAKFFADKIKTLIDKFNIPFIHFGQNPSLQKTKSRDISNGDYYINVATIVKLKSSDQIRLGRLDATSINNDTSIYEFILYNNLEQMLELKHSNNLKWVYYYFTLSKLMKNNIDNINKYIKEIIETFISKYENDVNLLYIVHNAHEFIEKNPNILKYSDISLYDHQKEIYTVIKSPNPKLILYIAPTGTGKTLTPLGLSERYKIIFVCAARHVGLALARSAISIGKKIAFAFGCSAAEDVRLHYFSAKSYTKDKRSGKIKKVDNTVGDKVEIIICDIRSYLSAMYYMASFNAKEEIVTYWDEPTITMDYNNHELHKVIKKNWKDNIIPNLVLSSATLPKLHELTQTISDFKEKFPEAVINNIVSHDCRKTIPLIDNNGFVVMPHYLHDNYNNILETVRHCEENMTLMRYFDLKEATDFIHYVEVNNLNKSSAKLERNIGSVDDIDMQNIKLYYLKVLKHIVPDNWTRIYNHFRINRVKRIKHNNTIDVKGNTIKKVSSFGGVDAPKPGESLCRIGSVQHTQTEQETLGSCGIYVTTKDAYTLTDGPTIFLANNLSKVAKFCIQQANIPAIVMTDINFKIEYNNRLNEKIDQLEKELEFEETKLASKLSGSTSDSSKEARQLIGKKDGKGKSKIANKIVDKTEDRKIVKIREDIMTLKSMAKHASIDDLFIPNRHAHLEKWASGLNTKGAFTSDIDDSIIVSIMLLKDVEDSWKILLLLGIGVFTQHKSIAYTEIMKKLADQQKLYLIIADSDYIYGTNYQFCHGYLSKDLELTQEKIIQALGRIGRNNIQQEYSARFRDDSQIETLFTRFASENKPEVINMNQLFNCKNVRWNGEEYVELPSDNLDATYEDDDEYENIIDDLEEDNECHNTEEVIEELEDDFDNET